VLYYRAYFMSYRTIDYPEIYKQACFVQNRAICSQPQQQHIDPDHTHLAMRPTVDRGSGTSPVCSAPQHCSHRDGGDGGQVCRRRTLHPAARPSRPSSVCISSLLWFDSLPSFHRQRRHSRLVSVHTAWCLDASDGLAYTTRAPLIGGVCYQMPRERCGMDIGRGWRTVAAETVVAPAACNLYRDKHGDRIFVCGPTAHYTTNVVLVVEADSSCRRYVAS